MRKVIFLDIDGVFNCNEFYRVRSQNKALSELSHPLDEFCPERVALFNNIIDATNAQIVVSSTWRHDGLEAMRTLFTQVGIKGEVIDITPCYRSNGQHVFRGNEIYGWEYENLRYPYIANPELQEQFEVKKDDGSFKCMRSLQEGVDYTYCIIDDDGDMLWWQRNNFVKTNWSTGLSKDHAQQAIEILNKKPLTK